MTFPVQCPATQQFLLENLAKHKISAFRVLEQTLDEIAGTGHAISGSEKPLKGP